MFVWAFAAVLGAVVAGLAGSSWAMITGYRPHPIILAVPSSGTPFKIAAVVLYGPLAFIRGGYEFLNESPVFGLAIMAVGVVWSFFQGVFILTTFFGFT